jgi:hypothetical protein
MPSLLALGDDRSQRDVLVLVLLATFVIVVTAFLVTVALDMEREPGGTEPATAAVAFDSDSDAIRVAFTSMNHPDTVLDVSVRNASGERTMASVRLTSVGASHAFEDLTNGSSYQVAVVAEWDGKQSLVALRSGQV